MLDRRETRRARDGRVLDRFAAGKRSYAELAKEFAISRTKVQVIISTARRCGDKRAEISSARTDDVDCRYETARKLGIRIGQSRVFTDDHCHTNIITLSAGLEQTPC